MQKLSEWICTGIIKFKAKYEIIFERIVFLLLSVILFTLAYTHDNIFRYYPSPHPVESDNITALLLKISAFISLACFIINILHTRWKK